MILRACCSGLQSGQQAFLSGGSTPFYIRTAEKTGGMEVRSVFVPLRLVQPAQRKDRIGCQGE
jgi:hypothetical protein